MEYAKEIKTIINTIPKEHHKSIQKIIELSYSHGVSDLQYILNRLVEIDPKKINEYYPWHESDIDGG